MQRKVLVGRQVVTTSALDICTERERDRERNREIELFCMLRMMRRPWPSSGGHYSSVMAATLFFALASIE